MDIIRLGEKPEITLDHACGYYWRKCSVDLSPGHARNVKDYIFHILRVIGKETPMHMINDAIVSHYATIRRNEPVRHNNKSQRLVSGSTVNRELSTLGRIFRIVGKEYLVGNVDWSAHRQKEPKPIAHYQSRHNIDTILSHMTDETKRRAVRAALYTGARRNNTLFLHSQNTDWEAREFRFVAKGGRQITIPMIEPMYNMLTQEMGITPEYEGYFFCRENGEPYKNLIKGLQGAAKRAGVGHLRWHDLRHTCASWLIQNGVDVTIVQKLLGHSQISTTQRYIGLEVNDVRHALDKIFAAEIRHTSDNSENLSPERIFIPMINIVENGASDGDRTHDLQCHKLADTYKLFLEFQEFKRIYESEQNAENRRKSTELRLLRGGNTSYQKK